MWSLRRHGKSRFAAKVICEKTVEDIEVGLIDSHLEIVYGLFSNSKISPSPNVTPSPHLGVKNMKIKAADSHVSNDKTELCIFFDQQTYSRIVVPVYV